MTALRLLTALTVFISGFSLPLVTAEVDVLQLGGLFDDDSALGIVTSLRRRHCLPTNTNPSEELLVWAQCSQQRGCPDAARDDVLYECLARRTGMISGDKFNKDAFSAFLKSHTTDNKRVSEKRLLVDVCLSTLNTSLTGGQQAVHIISCLQWSLLLDCDLHEQGGKLSGEASCRRAAFLAGDCPLSPPAILQNLAGVAAESSWEQCAAGLNIPDGADTEQQCRQMDTAAVRLVSCRLKQYVNTSGKLDVDRLRTDVTDSQGDDDVKEAMLKIVKGCGRDSGSVEKFVGCWAMRGIMSCAASEAAQRASEYKSC